MSPRCRTHWVLQKDRQIMWICPKILTLSYDSRLKKVQVKTILVIHVMGVWEIPSDLLCKLHLRRRTLFRRWTSRRKLRRSRPELMWPNTTETMRSQQKPTVTSLSKLIKFDQRFLLLLWPRFQTASNALKCQRSETQLESENSQSLKILKHPGHLEADTLLSSLEWMVWIWYESLIHLIVHRSA